MGDLRGEAPNTIGGKPPEWGAKLSQMVCPQCKRPFVLTWNDYSYDEQTKTVNSGTRSTLVLRGCPSGGLYDVLIACPHCDYQEEL